jgi:NADH:ubiquinone oxidoreductase subunit K
MNNYLFIDLACVAIIFCIGIYTLLVSRNLIRILIGFEIVAKGVTLAIISAGFANGRFALSQAMTITFIVLEVVFVAVALAIIMLIQRRKNSLDVHELNKLKG